MNVTCSVVAFLELTSDLNDDRNDYRIKLYVANEVLKEWGPLTRDEAFRIFKFYGDKEKAA